MSWTLKEEWDLWIKAARSAEKDLKDFREVQTPFTTSFSRFAGTEGLVSRISRGVLNSGKMKLVAWMPLN